MDEVVINQVGAKSDLSLNQHTRFEEDISNVTFNMFLFCFHNYSGPPPPALRTDPKAGALDLKSKKTQSETVKLNQNNV